MITIDVRIPGRVWYDFLDPSATDMQAELALPEPEHKRAGKGSSFIYRDVPQAVALDLAEYLYDRGDMLLGQGICDPYDPFEKAARDTLRAGIKAAESIRADEQRARIVAAPTAMILDASAGTIR